MYQAAADATGTILDKIYCHLTYCVVKVGIVTCSSHHFVPCVIQLCLLKYPDELCDLITFCAGIATVYSVSALYVSMNYGVANDTM